MKDILKPLLESELLSDEARTQIEESFNAHLQQLVESHKSQVEEEVTTRLTAQFVADKAELVEALDTKLEASLTESISELKDDIESFRDLEVEYATKLNEARVEMGNNLKSELERLVVVINEFLEERITAEITELNESIEEVKKITLGMKIFESFKNVFVENYNQTDETVSKLAESQRKVSILENDLNAAKTELSLVNRKNVMETTLSSLSGKSKEIMSAILESVETDKIKATYEKYIGRVLNESMQEKSNSEKDSVLAESDSEGVIEKVETVIVEGNSNSSLAVEDNHVIDLQKQALLQRVKRLAN